MLSFVGATRAPDFKCQLHSVPRCARSANRVLSTSNYMLPYVTADVKGFVGKNNGVTWCNFPGFAPNVARLLLYPSYLTTRATSPLYHLPSTLPALPQYRGSRGSTRRALAIAVSTPSFLNVIPGIPVGSAAFPRQQGHRRAPRRHGGRGRVAGAEGDPVAKARTSCRRSRVAEAANWVQRVKQEGRRRRLGPPQAPWMAAKILLYIYRPFMA